jgi:hypothetical protein
MKRLFGGVFFMQESLKINPREFIFLTFVV